MDTEEGAELLLLGYIVTDDDLWCSDVRQEEAEEPLAPTKCWTRPWIRDRDKAEANTMFKLQLEISEVSCGCPKNMEQKSTKIRACR